ncbi:MAG TPA: SulP family inorganic anion transporter [Xanthobacteraceae bacterium]|jgi:MFS superfamily sulfate permease-like transporter|nr:SulP family inorganic anion transporter [Xanthobacteraceae bacterium]
MPVMTRRRDWLFASLRDYSPAWLSGDLIAAMTLAAIAIPEQLATARLAGMPPMSGLFAFAAGTFAFAAFGANRFISVGADSTIAPIMAGALVALAVPGAVQYATMAAMLALLVGAILVLARILRTGWIADLLSIPVITGFLAGISIHIIVGQLPSVMGIEAMHGNLVDRFADVVGRARHFRAYPLAIGIGVLALSQLAERWNPRIPGALIGLVVSAIAVRLFALDQHGVAVLGALPIAPPALSLVLPNWDDITLLLPAALIVALVCMIQTAVVVRTHPSDANGEEDVTRDFAGVGAGCILAGFFGAFAVNASPPRTEVVQESGGRSQLSGLFAIAIVAAVVLVASGTFKYVPEAALSGVLIFIAIRLFRVEVMRQIYRRSDWEILIVAGSAALVVFLPIETGVTLSIMLSLLHSVYVIARPDITELARIPDTTIWWALPKDHPGEYEPGVLVIAPSAPVYFVNASYLHARLMNAIAEKEEPCRYVVIEAHGVIDIDFSGSEMLRQLIVELRGRGIDLAIARMSSERARKAARRTGLIDALGEDHLFRSVEEAIRDRPA